MSAELIECSSSTESESEPYACASIIAFLERIAALIPNGFEILALVGHSVGPAVHGQAAVALHDGYFVFACSQLIKTASIVFQVEFIFW